MRFVSPFALVFVLLTMSACGKFQFLDPEWPKGWKVLVERLGYDPVWIAAEDLPADVDAKYLLIQVKRTPR